MKKRYIILIILFLIASVSVLFFLNHKSINRLFKKELAGEKLTEGLYKYDLDVEEYNSGISIKEDYIYYLSNIEEKYYLHKLNIYNNKDENIGVVNTNLSICSMDKYYINCTSDAGINEVFDLKLNKIYEGNDGIIVYYKGDFVKIVDNIIYLKDKEFRKLDDKYKTLIMFNSYVFDDTTYLYYSDIFEKNFIYDITKDKEEEIKYEEIKQHSDGLYYYDKEKIIVKYPDETKEYKNIVGDEVLSNCQLDNNLLYCFKDDYLRIYNLELEKVKLFDYRLNESIYNIYVVDDNLFLTTSDKVWIVKLDEIASNDMTVEELETKLNNKLNERVEKLKTDYGVEFKSGKDADLKFSTFKESMTGERAYDEINDALDSTEEVFKMFGSEFFKEFIHNEYTGMRIYLVSDIKASFGMNGQQLRYYDKYAIIARSIDYKTTLCHELMHTIEDAVVAKNKEMFTKWKDYNPKGFKYTGVYDVLIEPNQYTIEYEKGDIYFVDNYSQASSLEDRARIFENVCTNTTSDIKKYPYLLKKAQYIEEETKKYYPMLKDSVIFDSLK